EVPRKCFSATNFIDDFLHRDGNWEDSVQLIPQLVNIPVFGTTTASNSIDVQRHNVIQEVLYLTAQVFAFQHSTTLVIHHSALPRKDIVILQDVFTNLKVAGLNLGLRRLDCPSDHLRFQR